MRLTIKDKEIRDNFNAEYAKLADLEDIEEELGIDLIRLFKALNSDVCYELDEEEIKEVDIWGCSKYGLNVTSKGYCFAECQRTLKFKDYGKTWALEREELL